jgi:rRNA maturation protein Rpf1
MMRATGARIVATFAILLAAAPAYAFRCGTRVITSGDPSDKVLQFCGSPVSVQTRHAERPYIDELGRSYLYKGLVEEVVIEEWTYNLGPNQFMRLVRIENGRVAEVKSLGYGY